MAEHARGSGHRRVVGGALLVLGLASAMAGCVDCSSPEGTQAITDAQLARVMQGTTSPTPSGCHAVCYELAYGIDAEGQDAAVRAIDESDPARIACSVSPDGHQLHCTWPVRCAR